MPAAVVILAAGAGSRVGGATNKVLLPLGDTSVLGHSLRVVLGLADVTRVVLVVRPGEEPSVRGSVAPLLAGREVLLVRGGPSRHASEWQALQALAEDIAASVVDVVAIHDGARPHASAELWTATIEAAREHGGALPVVPLVGVVSASLRPAPRGLVGVQTPQAFRALPLLEAYRRAAADDFESTDTAACVERYGDLRVVGVPSSAGNLKVTFPEDVEVALGLTSGRA